MHARLFALAAAGALTVFADAASAQPSAENKILAESLFRDGRKLMEEGRVAEACRKLEESHRLDPAPGTLINLAICHDKEGKIATAWGEYRESLALARQNNKQDREAICNERIEALEPLLPKVTIEVPAETRIPGLAVSRNGTTIQEAAWGSALPSDPGEVVVEAKAPGRKPWRTTARVERSGTLRIAVPPLVVDENAAVATTDTGAASTKSNGDSGRRLAGIITGAAGLVSLGVGTYFGIHTLDKRNESDELCTNPDTGAVDCSGENGAAGVAAMDEARTSAAITNATIGVGVVAVGVGTWLFLSSQGSSEDKPAQEAAVAPARALPRVSDVRFVPSVAPQGGGAWLTGRF